MSNLRPISIAALLIFCVLLPVSHAQAESKPSDADAAGIKKTLAAYTDAFNRHDAHAQALTYTEDADLTNTTGLFFHGRKEIEERFAFNFSDRNKDAHRTDTVKKIWMLTPDIAVVQADWQIMGAKAPDGSIIPVRKGLMAPVMRKENGQWLIAIFHEAEFPKAAAK